MITLVVIVGLIAACSTVRSSVNYTRGTEALEAQDYETAILHLTEAVRLDPDLSRNQNNLAAAYHGAGRIREGWPHIRRAVRLDPGNRYAVASFQLYWVEMVELAGLIVGASTSEVEKAFGSPDLTF